MAPLRLTLQPRSTIRAPAMLCQLYPVTVPPAGVDTGKVPVQPWKMAPIPGPCLLSHVPSCDVFFLGHVWRLLLWVVSRLYLRITYWSNSHWRSTRCCWWGPVHDGGVHARLLPEVLGPPHAGAERANARMQAPYHVHCWGSDALTLASPCPGQTRVFGPGVIPRSLLRGDLEPTGIACWWCAPPDVLLFSSGHCMRVLATRWVELTLTAHARWLILSTASLSAVGYKNELSCPVSRLWNETNHVSAWTQ